jgi:hypothetical protein
LAGDFLPLQFGNTWTYREASTGQEFTVRVSTPVFTGGQVYHSLSGYSNTRTIVRLNENKDLVYLSEDTGHEIVLTSFTPFEGGSWEAPLRGCEQLGQTQEKRVTHDGPAGPFQNVLDLRYRVISCADTGVTSEQFAENIGMVRRTVTSIAGPRQFDLVYARVGNVRIDAAPHAKFTVTVNKAPAADFYQATLRLSVEAALPLTLHFRSSQEYDAVLLDPEGHTVWQWSADQVFAQVAHQRSIDGEWVVSLKVPRSVMGVDESQARTYNLQVWLPTTGITPAFAGTFPIHIGPAPAR